MYVEADNRNGESALENHNFTSTEVILNENDSIGKRPEHTRLHKIDEKIRRVLDHPNIIQWICLFLLAGSFWVTIYSLTDSFIPGSQLFGMFALFTTAFLAGELLKLVKLPPLSGMLIMGFLLRNTGFIDFTGNYAAAASIFRHLALFVILTRAGLGLDPTAMKNLSCVIIRLAFGPTLVEVFVSTVISHFFLGLPWIWGALLGSILAAVSPAVVIPCLFYLQEKGYGTDKGIPTLVVAAASLDDILSISLFGIIISILFSTGSSLIMQIIKGPLGIIFGVIFGIFWGILLHYIPCKEGKDLVLFRVLMLAGGSLMIIFGSDAIGYPGAGPLGCIVTSLVANLGWKRDGWKPGNNPVAETYSAIWVVFQPILFGLIGAEVNLSVLDPHVCIYGVAALSCSLVIRLLITTAFAFGGNFGWKEKIFIAFAWFPKATVQAALGPIPLDKARNDGNEDYISYANTILILAVLAILMTAPLGAILITYLGPRLLSRNPDHELNQINNRKGVDNAGKCVGLS